MESEYIPIQIPDFPPEGPWAAYVLVVIWLPLFMRLMLLAWPFRRVIKRLAPHSGWALKQLKELPVRGFGLLAVNEVLAFLIPPFLVLIVRMQGNPIGWQTWGEVGVWGGLILFLSFGLWVFFDLLRIARVRRMISAVEKHDIEKLRKVADAGMKARGFLRRFSGKEAEEIPSEESLVKETGNKIAKNSVKIWATRALMARKLTPAGIVGSIAVGAALEAAKSGAGAVSDAVDKRLQKEFEQIAKTNSKTLLVLLLRDLAMGIVPLLILGFTPVLLG